MIYIIHPDMELWDFMLDGIRHRTDVKAPFVIGNKLQSQLKRLKKGDHVIVSANYTPVLHNALRSVVSDGVTLNLWMWNPVRATKILNKSIDLLHQIGVKLHTFDKDDSLKYDMIYHKSFYNMNVKLQPTLPKYDFYFLGAQKNRGEQIRDVEKLLSNYKCLFIIPEKLSDFISYKENLEHIKESSCIIEILQKNQYDITLRSLEALSFKKKLLTNNVNVKEYSFYNPNNIFIIGVDNNERLQDFLSTPYEEISEDIKKQYDINTWLESFNNL